MSGFIALGSSVVVSVGYFVLASHIGVTELPLLFIFLLVAFSLIGLTAPLSFAAVSVGLPALDIPYLILTTVLAGLSAIAAVMAHDAYVYIIGNAVAMAVGAIWFGIYGSRAVAQRCGNGQRASQYGSRVRVSRHGLRVRS